MFTLFANYEANNVESPISTIKISNNFTKIAHDDEYHNVIDVESLVLQNEMSGQTFIDAFSSRKSLVTTTLQNCMVRAKKNGYDGILFRIGNARKVMFVGDTVQYSIANLKPLAGRLPSKKINSLVIPEQFYSANLYIENVHTENDIHLIQKQLKYSPKMDSLINVRISQLKKSQSYSAAFEQEMQNFKLDSLAEMAVSLYHTKDYRPLKSFDGVKISLFDGRKNKASDLMPLFTRYYENVENVHQSTLQNNELPDYFVIVAEDSLSVAKAMKVLTEKLGKKRPQFVLLTQAKRNLDWAQLDTLCSAVYSLPLNTANAIDILTQSFFGGVKIFESKSNPQTKALIAKSQIKTRLAYSQPNMAHMSATNLNKIDAVMKEMISQKASPSGSVLVARNGRVIFNRAYGTTTYTSERKVTTNMLYDIASVSKVMGMLPVVMQLFDNKQLTEQTKLSTFFNLDTAKQKITIAELLLHQSGLRSSVPAHQLCIDSTTMTRPMYSAYKKNGYSIQIEPRLYVSDELTLLPDQFTEKRDAEHPIRISPNLFTTNEQSQKVYKFMDEKTLLSKTYRYSDMSFIYLQRIAEQITKLSLDTLFYRQIARPLGLVRMCYNPLDKYSTTQIVPTEDDKFFRKTQLCGTVHDQTAALLGGVAGNAGLFATSNELAKLAQLYLNGGTYGGVRLIKSKTIETFIARHCNDNRRGYGFDKPEFREGKNSPVTNLASPNSYGHSGFSGTLIWIDPDYDLIYIFLSNRICPDAYNNKLTKLDIRQKVHEIIYRSIDGFCEENINN